MRWRDITIVGEESGFIVYAERWTMEDVTPVTPEGEPFRITHTQDVESPKWSRSEACYSYPFPWHGKDLFRAVPGSEDNLRIN